MNVLEMTSAYFRIIGLSVVVFFSIYCTIKCKGDFFTFVLSGVVAAYFMLGYSMVLFFDWDAHSYLRLGWPLLVVVWIGLLLNTRSKQ